MEEYEDPWEEVEIDYSYIDRLEEEARNAPDVCLTEEDMKRLREITTYFPKTIEWDSEV